jgi:hypothetical protein
LKAELFYSIPERKSSLITKYQQPMDLPCQDEKHWCTWRHAEALFGRFFDYREMCLLCIPAHESQVMISTEGFDGVADVRSKRRQSDQAAPAAVWSCATWKSMITS